MLELSVHAVHPLCCCLVLVPAFMPSSTSLLSVHAVHPECYCFHYLHSCPVTCFWSILYILFDLRITILSSCLHSCPVTCRWISLYMLFILSVPPHAAFLPSYMLLELYAYAVHPECYCLLLLAFLPCNLLLEFCSHPVHLECHCILIMLAFLPSNLLFNPLCQNGRTLSQEFRAP